MIEICSSVSNNYEILLNKKAEKTGNFGANFELSENSNVFRHNFFCRAAILIWKVALESLYKQLSNAILKLKFGPRGPKI